MSSQNSAQISGNIQHKQYDASHDDGMALGPCQPRRPVSWAESTSELLASGAEMGHSASTPGGSSRGHARKLKLPNRAHTVAASPLSLRVELAERQYILQTTGRIETPETFRVERTRSAASKPTCPTTCIHASESDIELDDMSSRPAPTQGTGHPVPSIDGSHTDQVSSLDRESGESNMASQESDKPRFVDLRPDYKPTSLRWPFRVFLLALLAGLLAFLEYHIYDLPPPHYSILPVDQSRVKKLDVVAAAHHPATAAAASAKPLSLSPWQPATITTKSGSPTASSSTTRAYVTRPAKLRYQRRSPDPDPDPDPDPRPPETDFPVPDYYYDMYQTYCGWSPPTWTIDHWGVQCSDFSCDEFPILCSNSTDMSQLQCSLFELTEMMDTFFTDDPTWCPCGTWQTDDWYGAVLTEIEWYWWDTIDRGCKSVMLAVQSLNHFKSVELYRTVSFIQKPGDGPAPTPYTENTRIAQQFYTTPPLPAEAWWPYPSHAANGDVLIPLVVRTAGREVKDVYGNHVQPQDTATFPDGFQSLFFEDGDFNDCWGSLQRYNLKTGQPSRRCTDPPHVILSSVWWPLPLHPKTATTTATTMGSTAAVTTSVLQPGASTSTAEVPSTSTIASSGPDSTTSLSSTQSITESTRLVTPSSTAGVSVTQSTADSNGPTITLSSASAGIDTTTQPTRNSGNPTTTSLSSPSQRDPDKTPESTDGQTEISGTSGPATTEKSIASTGEPSSFPQTTSPARSSTLDEETRPVSGVTSFTPSSSSAIIVPIVGLVPEQSRSDSSSIWSDSGASISSRSTSDKAPAQLITTLTTQFNPNGTPIRTFTTIISTSASSSNQSIPDIPPPPFIIPVGSGWIPYDDNITNSKSGPNSNDPGGYGSGPVSPADMSRLINLRTEADYLMASVVPVLLASLLLIAVQIFNSSVNSVLPFRALTFDQGSSANESLLLSRSSNIFVSQPKVAYRFLAKFRDPLPFLNTLLASFALIMVPLSSEVIRLEFTRKCADPNWRPEYIDEDNHDYPADWIFFYRVCAFGLRKSVTMIRVAEGVLVTMATIVLVMGWLLTKWRSGMVAEPWSIVSMASLLAGSSRSTPTSGGPGQDIEPQQRPQPPDLAALLRRVPTTGPDIDTELKATLQDKSFRLGFLGVVMPEKKSYGIEVTTPGHNIQDDKNPIPRTTTRNPPGPPADQPFSRVLRRSTTLLSLAPTQSNNGQAKKRIPIPLISTLLFSTGLLILVLYYETTVIELKEARGQTALKYRFEAFMNSQSFGVRILFTAFGVVLSTFWDSYFLSTSEFQIHHRLAQKDGLPAERSILLSPSAHIFAGLGSSLSLLYKHTLDATRGRSDRLSQQSDDTGDCRGMSSQDIRSFSIALATFFAKFMPILLSNIPFHNTVTWKMHEACTWMAVIFMSYMVLLLLFLFSVDLLHMAPFQKFAGWFRRENKNAPQLTRAARLDDGNDGNKKKKRVVYMPVRVNTIAGCMYYLCESKMVNDFRFDLESSSMSESHVGGLAGGKDRKTEEKLKTAAVALDKRYFFGKIVGQAPGATRLAVDYCSERHGGDASSSSPPARPRQAGEQGMSVPLPPMPQLDWEPRFLGRMGRSGRLGGDLDIERGR